MSNYSSNMNENFAFRAGFCLGSPGVELRSVTDGREGWRMRMRTRRRQIPAVEGPENLRFPAAQRQINKDKPLDFCPKKQCGLKFLWNFKLCHRCAVCDSCPSLSNQHCENVDCLKPALCISKRFFSTGSLEWVFTLGDARLFSGLTSKIPLLGSMLNFDADVKK